MPKKGTIQKKVDAATAEKVMTSVRDLDRKKVLEGIGTLQDKISKELADVSVQISSKLDELENSKQAVLIVEERLRELYAIEAAALKFDDFEAQCAEKKRTIEANIAGLEQTFADTQAELDQQRSREVEAYNYNLAQSRKKAEDAYAAEQSKKLREENIRMELFEKNMAERQNAMKAQEDELINLRSQVAGFDERLKKEIAKEVAIVENRLAKDAKHKDDLVAAQQSATAQLHKAQTDALENQITGYKAQILTLETQLESARKDTKEVATQALQAGSGKQALDSIMQMGSQQPSSKGGK